MYDYSKDKRFWAGYKEYKLKNNSSDNSLLSFYKIIYQHKLLAELGRNNFSRYNSNNDNKIEMG